MFINVFISIKRVLLEIINYIIINCNYLIKTIIKLYYIIKI